MLISVRSPLKSNISRKQQNVDSSNVKRPGEYLEHSLKDAPEKETFQMCGCLSKRKGKKEIRLKITGLGSLRKVTVVVNDFTTDQTTTLKVHKKKNLQAGISTNTARYTSLEVKDTFFSSRRSKIGFYHLHFPPHNCL